MKQLLIPKQIITVNSNDDILTNVGVEIENGKINSFVDLKGFDRNSYSGEIVDRSNLTLIPGFVQTHIHLCQTLFRGLADDLELLDWLGKRIFPYENQHNPESLRVSAQLGITELQKGGTTTIVDMGTINHQEVIFEELTQSGMRAFAGKCMVDQNNLYPVFKETTKDSLDTTHALAKQFHNTANGRIKYGFAPRFVLSCTEGLLKDTYQMLLDFEGSLYHTHSSENKDELKAVWEMHSMGNIEYFESIGVLGNRTLLAHCVHVDDPEQVILTETDTRVLHCPSSNLKLGSGIANIPRYINIGINVSLGADGPPCNNNLSQFTEMRLAALIQKPIHGSTSMNAKDVFKMATIKGAEAVNLVHEIGSIEVGKKADLVFLNLDELYHPLNEDNLYSTIVYSTGVESVKDVMIDGEWVVNDGRSLKYDEKKIRAKGKEELEKLLNRVN
ncbi:MAG: amidohydrolase family protein [Bacteroidetes bacterium]|nr:amidohydrolase family protein [Bacteroidota bacterium]